jgi:hypothetical protein
VPTSPSESRATRRPADGEGFYAGGVPRSPRPSDVHRLAPGGAPAGPAPAPAGDPSRRPGRVALAAALLAAAVLLAVITRAPEREPGASLDVEVEDDAIAALALYLAQRHASDLAAAAMSRGRQDPAPLDAAHERVEEALSAARSRTDADVAARAYWGATAHDEFLERLAVVREATMTEPRGVAGRGSGLEPPAVVLLRVYLERLPPGSRAALRGHPVAAPALTALESP